MDYLNRLPSLRNLSVFSPISPRPSNALESLTGTKSIGATRFLKVLFCALLAGLSRYRIAGRSEISPISPDSLSARVERVQHGSVRSGSQGI